MNQALQDNCENEIDFKSAKTVDTTVYSLSNSYNHLSDDLISSRSILKPSNNINLQSSRKVKVDSKWRLIISEGYFQTVIYFLK